MSVWVISTSMRCWRRDDDKDVLKTAFTYLFEMEEKMNEICDQLGTADEETMTVLMDELGTIQDMLTMHDFT